MSSPGLRAALTGHQARSHPEHPNPDLRGRTYAIPFSQVWEAVVHLASGGMKRWSLVLADEGLGRVQAEAAPFLGKSPDDIEIEVSLDENAQTRVDMSSASRRERWDLGRNTRRISRFFRRLDKRVGAGPGNVLDPTLPLIRMLLLLAVPLLACAQTEEPAGEAAGLSSDSVALERNFAGRSYERHIVFLAFQGDSTLLVPLSFSTRTRPEGVEREIRGWLARGDTWDPFLREEWEGPPNSAPWRILPHGPVRLIVGLEDALETVIFQEGVRSLEVGLGDLLVEWQGQRAQTFRVHRGSVVLSDETVGGYLLDLSRGWAEEDGPPGDWGILISGDSVQIVMEDTAPIGGSPDGSFSLWARIQFLDRQWQRIRYRWSELRAFEDARRDVPMAWTLDSQEDEVSGDLVVLTQYLEAEEGEGAMLPVQALFQVEGILSFHGEEYPVRGFLRHIQR